MMIDTVAGLSTLLVGVPIFLISGRGGKVKG
jgi:hypothetical protein